VLGVLVRYYEKQSDEAKLKELDALKQGYMKSADLAKVVQNRRRAVDKLIKDKKYQDAYAELKTIMQDFPDQRWQMYYQAARIAHDHIRSGDLAPLREMSALFDGVVPPAGDGRAVQSARELFEMLLPALLGGADATQELKRLEDTLTKNPDLEARLGYFVRGELWARAGEKGPCPKRLYLVRFRPDEKIDLDGRLDEAVYRASDPLPGPYWLHAGETTPLLEAPKSLALTVTLFYTKDSLYVGLRVPEPQMGSIRLSKPAGPVQAAWEDDAIEFFIEFERCLGKYQQWVVNANGGHTHLHLYGGAGVSANSMPDNPNEEAMEAATQKESAAYTMELRIPLSQFPVKPPLSGKLMNANIRRMRWLADTMQVDDAYKGRQLATISWAKAGHGHQTNLYEFLRFE